MADGSDESACVSWLHPAWGIHATAQQTGCFSSGSTSDIGRRKIRLVLHVELQSIRCFALSRREIGSTHPHSWGMCRRTERKYQSTLQHSRWADTTYPAVMARKPGRCGRVDCGRHPCQGRWSQIRRVDEFLCHLATSIEQAVLAR